MTFSLVVKWATMKGISASEAVKDIKRIRSKKATAGTVTR